MRVISGLVREFGMFLKEDRTWWLAPILVVLGALGAFTVFVQGSRWRRSSTRCSKGSLRSRW